MNLLAGVIAGITLLVLGAPHMLPWHFRHPWETRLALGLEWGLALLLAWSGTLGLLRFLEWWTGQAYPPLTSQPAAARLANRVTALRGMPGVCLSIGLVALLLGIGVFAKGGFHLLPGWAFLFVSILTFWVSVRHGRPLFAAAAPSSSASSLSSTSPLPPPDDAASGWRILRWRWDGTGLRRHLAAMGEGARGRRLTEACERLESHPEVRGTELRLVADGEWYGPEPGPAVAAQAPGGEAVGDPGVEQLGEQLRLLAEDFALPRDGVLLAAVAADVVAAAVVSGRWRVEERRALGGSPPPALSLPTADPPDPAGCAAVVAGVLGYLQLEHAFVRGAQLVVEDAEGATEIRFVQGGDGLLDWSIAPWAGAGGSRAADRAVK